MDQDELNQEQSSDYGAQGVEQMAESGSSSLKKITSNTLGTAAQKGLKRAGHAVAKAAARAIKALAQAIVKLIAAMGPWVIVVIVLILVIAAAFNYTEDERGSSSQLTLEPTKENPTETTEDGYLKATALTESQALIDAYYKYLACDSFQKVYIDDSGNITRLQFSNVTQTSDFAGLTDLFQKENYFYLSSYFIKMTDELFAHKEYYFPEQVIKPVYSDALPLESPEPDEVGKLYITTLPLVDDGSPNAQILYDHLSGGTADGPYAVGSSLVAPGEDAPKREVNDDASKSLLAQSKEYEESSVTLTLEDGTTGTYTLPVNQTDVDTAGIWDYGFGSVLQYEPKEKNMTLSVSKVSFDYHYHLVPWTLVEYPDGTSTIVYDEDAAVCYDNSYEINLGADTGSGVIDSINTYIESFEADYGTHGTEARLIAYPAASQIQYMIDNQSDVEMWVSVADQDLAGIYYDNDTIQDAFGNARQVGADYIRAEKYPLKVPVINAAAAFSGSIRYKYSDETRTNDIMDQVGTRGTLEDNWADDCSTIEYAALTCGGTTNTYSIQRAGTVTTTQPSSVPEEISNPTGFQYVEDYGSHYEVYVPDKVRTDMDFKERVYAEQDGASSLTDAEKQSYDADGDGDVTVMDFLIKLGLLTPYMGGTLGPTGGITQGEISGEDQADMASMGCGMDEEGQVRLLAKVIGAEAGPNKLDQLLVGCVVVNRVYSSEFAYADSIIEVIKAPGQYASWSNGSIQACEPTQEMLSSARQILNGEFSIPSNIVFQAAFTQGDTVWLTNVNGTGYYTHYYCCNGVPSTTDVFGRTAMTADQARTLAESLHQADIASGYASASGGGGSGIPASPGGSSLIEDGEWNGEKLYANQGFNLQTTLATMRKVSDKESLGFLGTIAAYGRGIISSILEQVQRFFNALDNVFGNDGDYVEFYATEVALSDMRDTVIQAVTFSNQDTYSNVAEEFDPDLLQFLFVGESGWAGAAQGTASFGGGTLIPGTGSTFSGFGSPTSVHYSASSPWSASSGSATIAVPEGTSVLSVGDCRVTDVSNSGGTYSVTMTADADGKTLTITYRNLSSVSVSVGDTLAKGDTVGIAGAGGLEMTLLVDGVNVDPMNYFYQPSYGSGVSFYDVLNESGLIDETKKNELAAMLNAANVSPSGPYDKWHDPSFNDRSVGQCTWWAWGRGYQYCEQNGCMPSGKFGYQSQSGYGNGVDYFTKGAEDFVTDRIAAPNSWISWAWTSPDSSGNWYGHVAFVEAVGADGTILISDTGSGLWFGGTGIRVRTIPNTGTATNPNYDLGSKYRFQGFVHLDQPK